MIDQPAPRTRQPRSDGEQSRERLMHAGLRLFAHQGFARTSTREIAEAAGVNLAAISYYFGDKEGLYRAVFFETQGKPADEIARYAGPTLTLAQALRGLFTGFVEPLKEGDTAQLCTRLHAREYLDPTGLWQQEIAEAIAPMHAALVQVLARHLGLREPDEEVQRLALCVAGLGVNLHVCTEVIDALAPSLKQGATAYDTWLDRLVMFAEAMVQAEIQRRAPAAAPPRRLAGTTKVPAPTKTPKNKGEKKR